MRDSGGVLALQTLFFADEIRGPYQGPAPPPQGRPVRPLQMAGQLGRGDERAAEPADAGVFCAVSVLCALAPATGLLTTRARCHRPRTPTWERGGRSPDRQITPPPGAGGTAGFSVR